MSVGSVRVEVGLSTFSLTNCRIYSTTVSFTTSICFLCATGIAHSQIEWPHDFTANRLEKKTIEDTQIFKLSSNVEFCADYSQQSSQGGGGFLLD